MLISEDVGIGKTFIISEIIRFSQIIRDLSDLDFKIISYIGKNGPSPLKNIFTELKSSKSTISYHINLLEQKDILARIPTTSKDKPIELTDKGKKIFLIAQNENKAGFNEIKQEDIRLNKELTKKEYTRDFLSLCKDSNLITERMVGKEDIGDLSKLETLLKKQTWEDLLQLIKDENIYVRGSAAKALGLAFPHISDKIQAWEGLHRLIHDENSYVRWNAIEALGSAFLYVPNKEQAWEDLQRSTLDGSSDVQWSAAEALGAVFPYIPDKKQAWEDLQKLAADQISGVRMSANYSLGRASIFKATEAKNEEDFRRELENALKFFEISLGESAHSNFFSYNPARFCLPFYKSFYTLIFKKEDSEIELQKYLAEAKPASEGSETKEKLLEVVGNLSNALREIQKTQEMDIEAMKHDLDAYRKYCERALDLLDITAEKAPGATKLIRRGLPIIDQKIKEIISEIQSNAEALCKQTKGTAIEDLGKEVYYQSQDLLQIRDPIGLEKGMLNMQTVLSIICAKMPEEERGEARELLKKAGDELYIEDKLPLINMVLSKISSQISTAKNIEVIEKRIDRVMVSLKSDRQEELTVTIGDILSGADVQHITIPLHEISYPELKDDLAKINGRDTLKLASLPTKLAEKIRDYLIRNKKNEL